MLTNSVQTGEKLWLKQKLGEDKVYLTSQNGTIEFITDGEKLWVKAG